MRLQARERGLLRDPGLEAEAGRGRSSHARAVGPHRRAPRALRRAQRGGEEICEVIVERKLKYKEVVGRLPGDVGLTPAIMVALLPSLSDRDLCIMTPTLEELGLLTEQECTTAGRRRSRPRPDRARAQHHQERQEPRGARQLEEAADGAVHKAVAAANPNADLQVMFLIDKSGSMEGAIEKSKEALSRILAGFEVARVHIATFDTMGTVLVPRAQTRAAVQHMLAPIRASGGTIHASAVQALARAGVRQRSPRARSSS